MSTISDCSLSGQDALDIYKFLFKHEDELTGTLLSAYFRLQKQVFAALTVEEIRLLSESV